MQGNMTDTRGQMKKEVLEVWKHDPVEITQDLIGHAPFNGHIAYEPVDVQAQGNCAQPTAADLSLAASSVSISGADERWEDEGSPGEAHGDVCRRWHEMRDARTSRQGTSSGSLEPGGSAVSQDVVDRVYEQMCNSEWWKEITVCALTNV